MTVDPRAFLNVGAVLVRRDPQGDVWDRLRVEGFQTFDTAVEVVVRPADTFMSAVHVDAEALDANYVIEHDGDPARDWSSDPLDVLLRRDPTVTTFDPRTIKTTDKADTEPGRAVRAWREYQEETK